MTKLITDFFKNGFIALLLLLPQLSMADAQKAELYVVKFHADWCGSCRVLGPNIEKARGKAALDDDAVLFVKLDLTDATSRNQAGLMASAIGLGTYYEENSGKTGYALLVDPETGATKGRLTKDMDAGKIIEAIQNLL